MKKHIVIIVLLLFVCLAAIFCFSSGSNQKTIISGTIPEYINQQVVLYYDTLKFNTTTNSQGIFTLEVNIANASLCRLNVGKNIKLYLSPGDEVNISKGKSGFVFNGANAGINNYLIEWDSYYSKADTMQFNDYYSLKADQFLSYTQGVLNKLLDHFHSVTNSNNSLNEDIIYIEESRLKYLIYNDRNFYSSFMANSVPGQLKNDFYAYLNNTELNNEQLLCLSEYTNFLKSYADYKCQQNMELNSSSEFDPVYQTKILLDVFENEFTDQRIIDLILPEKIEFSIMSFQMNDLQMDRFNKLCKSEKAKDGLNKFYNDTKRLFPGTAAPEFLLHDEIGRKYTLSEFKGKYLLIDVWESICAPCIREFPQLQEIEKNFKGKDIVFMSVSLDKLKNAWIKTKKTHNLHGIQLLADKGWQSAMVKDYKILFTPRYILIDKEGKIKYPQMPVPSKGLENILQSIDDL